MSSNELFLTTTLEGHTATITAVEFSPDGRFLASAGDDGVMLIFSTSSWSPVCRFLDASPVSVLLWHKKKRYLLICGHQSGDLHILTMSTSMVDPVCLKCCKSTNESNRNVLSSRLQHSGDAYIPYPSRPHLLESPLLMGMRSL
jgi:WD40 repeat protein